MLESRKQDTPRSELERQRLAYRELLASQRNVVVIDAGASFDAVVVDTTAAILAYSESRTRAQLGLPRNQESVNPHEKGQTNVRIPVREYVVISANSIARDILSRSSLGALHSQQEEFNTAASLGGVRVDAAIAEAPVAATAAIATPLSGAATAGSPLR